MDDKNVLLDQLRIDRSADSDNDSGSRRWVILSLSVILVLALAGGVWWWLARPSGIPVAEAVAREVGGTANASGGATVGASMLDASGYVVARRQATVASKRMGRVMEVAIEEGQRVKKDQVIATVTETMLAGMRRQPAAGRVSRLKMPKSMAVATTPMMQKSRNCVPAINDSFLCVGN